MRIRTPGFSTVSQRTHSVGATNGARIGIVLETHGPTNNQPRFYNGITADVLLLDDLHEIKDVLIPVLFGGASTSLSYTLDATDSDYVSKLRTGQPLPHPSTSSDAELRKWGAWVIVDVLSCGTPWICGYLPHPARPIEHLPQRAEAGSRMTDLGLQSVVAGGVEETTWAYSEASQKDDIA